MIPELIHEYGAYATYDSIKVLLVDCVSRRSLVVRELYADSQNKSTMEFVVNEKAKRFEQIRNGRHVNPTYDASRPTDTTLARPCRALVASRRPPRAAQGCARPVGGARRALAVQRTSLSRTGGSQT